MLRFVFSLLVAFCTTASAQELRNLPPTPHDFSWQWPVSLKGDEDLLRLVITPEVYARLWRDDLRDVVIFNRDNDVVPMGLLDDVVPRAQRNTALPPLEAPLFRVPLDVSGNPQERVRLTVSQRSDGRLERVATDVDITTADETSPSAELLIDLSGLSVPARGLLVSFQPDSAPLVARVDVFGSRDLSRWTRLTAAQALVLLNENGLTLERNRIELADTPFPYLRLQRIDSRDPLPVAQVQALRGASTKAPEAPLSMLTLHGQAEAQPGSYQYHSGGPFPVSQANVLLGERNNAITVIIESRSRTNLPWRERARGAVFRLSGKNGEIESAALDIGLTRDREWRIRTEPALKQTPALVLGYRPDQWIFMAQGEGPYRLAAGSAHSQRGHFPLQAVYQELSAHHDDTRWINEATLGRGAELAGSAALAPRPDATASPTPWQWLLWILLVTGTFAVVVMVLKLLRQDP